MNLTQTPISAVLFDYGMVLSAPRDSRAWEAMQHLLGCDSETLEREYWVGRDAYDRGKLSGEEYWQHIAKRLHETARPDAVNQLLAADTRLWSEPNAPMVAWAQRLKTEGITTAILSNLGDAMEIGLRECLPWLGAFHPQIFSHRLHCAKPDDHIFAHAIAELGVPAAQILFIDDRPDNVGAAKRAGMNALLYRNHEEFTQAFAALGETGLPARP